MTGNVHFLFIVLTFTKVACWTYDLEEVRKFFDEQQRHEEEWYKHHNESASNDEGLGHEDSSYGIGNYNYRGHYDGDSYHNHGSHEHHGHQHHENHKKLGNLNYRDSHDHHGRPKNIVESYFNHGLHHESSHYNYLKPYTGETREYAKDYGYDTYMGIKLHGIMRNGTRYLEGLRLAIENFKDMVENCTRATTTPFPGLRYNGSLPGMELFNSSSVMGLDSNMPWPQIFNMTSALLGVNTSNPFQRVNDAIPGARSRDTGRCANATKEREQVRRLADLAMHTVRQLQDLAMKKRHKDRKHEEIELLVRLAWFLERIAHITGFDPEADSFAPTESSQQMTTPVFQNPLILNISDEVKRQMMDCLRENSTTPATIRCNIPVDMPPILRMMYNIPENTNEGSSVLSNPAPEPAGERPVNPTIPRMIENPMPIENSPDLPKIPGNPSEITSGSIDELIGNQMPNLPLPELSSESPLSVISLPEGNPSEPPPLEAIQTAASDQMSKLTPFSRIARSIRKRSIDDPMFKVAKYYVKHKIWSGSNIETSETTIKDNLSVDNDISTPSVEKGSVDYEPSEMKIKSKFIRGDEAIKSVQKRAVKYQDWVVSRQSEDPQQDISYYIKNKEGTNIMASLVGAAQARIALERIFQTGNIEVVRRYGANYNPLIPSPFYFGLVKTLADI